MSRAELIERLREVESKMVRFDDAHKLLLELLRELEREQLYAAGAKR